MKANYTKPLLVVEAYSLTQSGARNCADSIPKSQINMNDPGNCYWDLGGGTKVFVAEPTCNFYADPTNTEVYCYNNPSEGNYTFHS